MRGLVPCAGTIDSVCNEGDITERDKQLQAVPPSALTAAAR
jgi:hypothetical protein